MSLSGSCLALERACHPTPSTPLSPLATPAQRRPLPQPPLLWPNVKLLVTTYRSRCAGCPHQMLAVSHAMAGSVDGKETKSTREPLQYLFTLFPRRSPFAMMSGTGAGHPCSPRNLVRAARPSRPRRVVSPVQILQVVTGHLASHIAA